MTKILNHINTYADLTAYNNDMEKDYPNVSYLVATDEVKWNKYDPDHIVCKLNVTSTESATKLLNSNTGITYQIIDGVKQDAVQTSYTFDTLGEHIVKYKIMVGYTGVPSEMFKQCTSLTVITIPNSVTSIGQNAFSNCSGLTSVTIPDSVTSIGRNALGVTGLTTITIPNSVITIDTWSLGGNTNLLTITIGSGVTSIGQNTFKNCSSLTSFTINATTPPTLGSYAFTNTNNCPIYVPAASVNAYKAATNWSSLASRIKPIS